MSLCLNALAIGAAVWLLAHGYQHNRIAALEAEDAAMLSDARREGRDRWVAAVRPQIALRAVAPSTVRALVDEGLLERSLSAFSSTGSYARAYDPTLSADSPWAPLYLIAALAGLRFGIAGALFCATLVAVAQADIRFRIVPIPYALALAVSGVAAFWPRSPLQAIALMAIITALIALLGALIGRLAKVREVAGLGDSILLAIAAVSLIPTGHLAHFAALFALTGAAALAYARLRGRDAWFKTALGPLIALPVVVCLAVM